MSALIPSSQKFIIKAILLLLCVPLVIVYYSDITKIDLSIIYGLLCLTTLVVFWGIIESNRIEDNAERRLFILASLFFLGVGCAIILLTIYQNYTSPRAWDFLCFYVNSKVAQSHLNFYQPEHYHAVFEAMQVPVEIPGSFERKILNVGFNYPPPTMLLFYPLAYTDYQSSQLIWGIVNMLLLFGIIYVLRDSFFDQRGIKWGLLVAILVLIHPGTRKNLSFSQSHFFILLSLVCAWKTRNKAISGMWIALATVVKPLAVIMGFYLLLRKNYKALGLAILTGMIMSLLSIAFFGFDTFITYFLANPNLRVSYEQYIGTSNQSLLAYILRGFAEQPLSTVPMRHPLFLVSSLMLFGSSLVLGWYDQDPEKNWSWALFLCCGLLLYPGTLTIYSIYLLVPILLSIYQGHQMPNRRSLPSWLLFLFIPLLYVFSYKHTFWAHLGVWIFSAWMIWGMNQQREGSVELLRDSVSQLDTH